MSDIGEAGEIASNYPGKDFLIKPVHGSGGYGIRELSEVEDADFTGLLLQEKLTGVNLSASVISTGSESRSIFTSQQIMGSSSMSDGTIWLLRQHRPFN